MILVPAYGREYKSAKAVKEDWDANKDFRISDISSPDDGRYINKQDAPKGSYSIRYNQLAKVCIVKV
jgi:plasmid maintenance system killer protein